MRKAEAECKLFKITRVVGDNMFMNFCPSGGYKRRKVSSDWKHVFFWWVELGRRWEAEKWMIALAAHSVDLERGYSSTFGWFLLQCRGIKRKNHFWRKLHKNFWSFNYSIEDISIPSPAFLQRVKTKMSVAIWCRVKLLSAHEALLFNWITW